LLFVDSWIIGYQLLLACEMSDNGDRHYFFPMLTEKTMAPPSHCSGSRHQLVACEMSDSGDQHFSRLTEETMAPPSYCGGSQKSRIQGRKMNNEPKNMLDYICMVSFSQMKGIIFAQVSGLLCCSFAVFSPLLSSTL
jgi:hypothetical protein